MASISPEEENYVRMSLLLTGISPRAARVLFDREFHPSCLDSSLKKAYKTLFDLKKKHVINAAQWNLLFTRFPDVPDSRTFDVTLMILLLRHLTPMTPPLCGFDRLPSAMETTSAADLTRIKHYRNHLAHLVDGKLDTGFFNTAWNDITCAIDRLGAQQMKQECEHLKTKPLDQTNQEIMIDIKHSFNEIRELKESFESLKISHTKMIKSHELLQEHHAEVKQSHEMLQEDYTEIKKSHKTLQNAHRNVTDEMEKIKTSQNDIVPWNIRERINGTLKDWKENDDKMYINTRAAKYVLNCIKKNSCVTITASSGTGKTATLRHVALQMAKEEFDVLPVTDPVDIVKFGNPKQKTLFVVDDLCGNFSLDQSDIKSWEPIMEDIKKTLDKKQTKILAACRLQVFQDEKFESLSVFKSCVCNMLSENICLSKTEKKNLAQLYLNAKASEISAFYDIYDCFPLLCKLYHDNPKLIISDFFQNPFSIYEAEIDKLLKKGHHAKNCVLALCVVFNNMLKEEMFTEEVNEETRAIIENTCEACRLDRGTSRLVLQDELDSLTHTFIKKERNMYKIIHDKIFDFLAKIYGQKIIYCLIRNADIGLIKERFLLEKKADMDQFITIIPTKYHQMYIQRMLDDWSKGKLQDVFNNINMKIPLFRQKLLCFLKTLDKSYQRHLAHICNDSKIENENRECVKETTTRPNIFEKRPKGFKIFKINDHTYDTSLLHCCYLGDISLVKWCCDHGVNINRCTNNGQSPIMMAYGHGQIKIVEILLDSGADYNKQDKRGQSLIMMACGHGQIEIVKMLLDRGADSNKCNDDGQSPIMMACEHGHTDIVKMVLDRGADSNKCNDDGQSPIMMACEHGHTDIVNMLLERGADYNKCNKRGQSPIVMACEHGHTDIVKMLLDRGADYNTCENWGYSPAMKACDYGRTEILKMLLDRGAICNGDCKFEQLPLIRACELGHTETVKMLLDRGASCNKYDSYYKTPVLKACENDRTELVKMLLDRGANCNKCGWGNWSPVMEVCENGNTEIVKMLLDGGADFDQCDTGGRSPIMMACKRGHTDIVKMLLDRGADSNKCNDDGQSPIMMACERGHKDIVKMLLERGTDYNKCNKRGQSPVMKACKYGHKDIVKMLLERGTDFNKCNKRGQSPVMKACKYGHTEIVKMLLDRGADFKKCDNRGQSTVITACEHGHTDIVKMVLDRGADYNKCDDDGQSPIMMACERGLKDIVKMLLERGADYNKCDKRGQSPVMKACEHGHSQIDIIKMLSDRGIGYLSDEVIQAGGHGHTEIVEMLLDRGVDYNTYDNRGQSPIMTACIHGHTEIVKMLLDRGADSNKCNKRGQSPIMMACEHGHTDIVKMLLERGADYNKCNDDGQSPIMMACELGHTDIVNMLLDRGADYNKCNKRGQSPIMMACEHGHTDIVNMLLDRGADLNVSNYKSPYSL
ncbi:uncharacterized protein LOC134709933 [Mytilus trossulus]|uniref:uncharacterized protein LOC134709933 n=1 Tax=Mytilus trossulus TaxID=6551 RepID=UPI0030079CC5